MWFAHFSLSDLILRCSCHTLNIWKASLLCGFCHLSSSCLLVRMSSCTWRIWMASLLYGFSHVSFSGLISRSSCHTSSIWKASLLFESSHAPSRNLILKNTCHTLCTWTASLQCGLVSPSNFMLRADWRPRHFELLPFYSKKLLYRSACPQSRGEGGRALSVKDVKITNRCQQLMAQFQRKLI